jgi:WD40 repeat protein
MLTQQTVSVLALHTASVKQVKFQPGAANNSVVATSARDGNVHIWDLRCRNNCGPVHSVQVALDSASDSATQRMNREPTYGSTINHIFDAHRATTRENASLPSMFRGQPTREPFGRTGEVSVTSISFLPEGREHLLLTASEANSSVKLWDIRSLHNTRRSGDLSLSSTALPENHNRFRHFGTCSMNLNGDGSRIYTLCKDNTIYAYSTAHLILGSAPELSLVPSRPRQKCEDRTGLGPLYGYRHPKLHATSFYVKTALRPAKDGRAEMLAVGSNDGCAVVFPTDDRYLSSLNPSAVTEYPDRGGDIQRSYFTSTPSSVGGVTRYGENILISQNGSPLIRGHDREVGAVAWTPEGELITVGDDYIVRCWREGDRARNLRTGGEDEGRRWGCGWADVDPSHDEGDED